MFYLAEGISPKEILSYVFDVVYRSNPVINGF
jgi:hypothetical protein